MSLAVAAVVTAGVFLQEPGRLVPETKLDLLVNPAGFLGRTLHFWDSRQALGQIPNQYAGYLFPMGPFYAIGHAVGVPMWIVQRCWISILLLAAFFGVRGLLVALGIANGYARLAGAAAFALSPMMLLSVAQASGGLVPAALVPWALAPLVKADRGGSTRRAAARSGLAVAAMGGINAASVVGAVTVPLAWLITRRRGPRRRALFRWWVVCVGLGCLFWVGPLLLQSKFGLHFQRYTETASTTTATSSTVEVVRGTGYWLADLFTKGPWLRAGWELASNRLAVLATGLLAAGGLAGIVRRDAPERVFLCLAAALGTALLVTGYGGPLGSPLAGISRSALDGPLSAVRNLSKFQPLVRLPLSIGLAVALSHVRAPTFGGRLARVIPARMDWHLPAALLGLVVVGLGALPLFDGHLANVGGFAAIPDYWRQTAVWLNDQPVTGTNGNGSLLVPGAAFGEYKWGRPLEEPLQTLSRTPWAVRDLVPLGSVGATTLLDAIESRLDNAQPDVGLAPVLARAGIRHLIVRNDLDLSRVDAPAPIYLRDALAVTPGLRMAASFGPPVSCGARPNRPLVNLDPSHAHQTCQAVDVYDVEGLVSRASLYPAASTTAVSGGTGSMLSLADSGLLAGRATVLVADPAAAAAGSLSSWVVTDDVQRRNQLFGSLRNTLSYPLTADERAPGTARAPQQRLVVPGVEHQSVVVMSGAKSLTASSFGTLGFRQPQYQPYAAFDGDPSTTWVADGPRGPVGEWIELNLTRPVDIRSVEVRLLDDGSRARATHLSVATARGVINTAVVGTEASQTLPAPGGLTSWIRITITGATELLGGQAGVGIREIAVPGVTVDRTISVPDDLGRTDGAPVPTFIFHRSQGPPGLAGAGQGDGPLDRSFVTRVAATFGVTGTAVPASPIAGAIPPGDLNSPCGDGPSLIIDGRTVPTTATSSAQDPLWSKRVTWRSCSPLALSAGQHHLTSDPNSGLAVAQLTLTPNNSLAAAAEVTRRLAVQRWGDESRSLNVGPGAASFLALTENYNSGWHAELNGHPMKAVRLDGWRQAWLVPPGPGGVVHLRFQPGDLYRWFLLLGLLGVIVLGALALRPGEDDRESSGPASLSRWFATFLAVAAVAWIAGPVAIFVPLFLLLPDRALRLASIAAATFATAALLVALRPGQIPGSGLGAYGAAAQFLAAMAIAAVLVSLVPTGADHG